MYSYLSITSEGLFQCVSFSRRTCIHVQRRFAINSLPTGEKWHSKAQSLAIFDPRSSIVNSVFDCRLSYLALFNMIIILAGRFSYKSHRLDSIFRNQIIVRVTC